jgi:hypothetical protein
MSKWTTQPGCGPDTTRHIMLETMLTISILQLVHFFVNLDSPPIVVQFYRACCVKCVVLVFRVQLVARSCDKDPATS